MLCALKYLHEDGFAHGDIATSRGLSNVVLHKLPNEIKATLVDFATLRIKTYFDRDEYDGTNQKLK